MYVNFTSGRPTSNFLTHKLQGPAKCSYLPTTTHSRLVEPECDYIEEQKADETKGAVSDTQSVCGWLLQDRYWTRRLTRAYRFEMQNTNGKKPNTKQLDIILCYYIIFGPPPIYTSDPTLNPATFSRVWESCQRALWVVVTTITVTRLLKTLNLCVGLVAK